MNVYSDNDIGPVVSYKDDKGEEYFMIPMPKATVHLQQGMHAHLVRSFFIGKMATVSNIPSFIFKSNHVYWSVSSKNYYRPPSIITVIA